MESHLPRRPRKDQLLAYFDGLPPLEIDDMIGSWRGTAWNTGSIFHILLAESGWSGKVFRSRDDVDALVFSPRFSPIALINRAMILPWRLPEDATKLRHPLGAARLRMKLLRGQRSAAMCYRALPIVDHFRKIDEGRVMGFMEIGGSGVPELFFSLERE